MESHKSTVEWDNLPPPLGGHSSLDEPWPPLVSGLGALRASSQGVFPHPAPASPLPGLLPVPSLPNLLVYLGLPPPGARPCTSLCWIHEVHTAPALQPAQALWSLSQSFLTDRDVEITQGGKQTWKQYLQVSGNHIKLGRSAGNVPCNTSIGELHALYTTRTILKLKLHLKF